MQQVARLAAAICNVPMGLPEGLWEPDHDGSERQASGDDGELALTDGVQVFRGDLERHPGLL